MQNNLKSHTKTFGIKAMLCLFACLISFEASAACIAGLPCITPKTINDSFDPSDGPNITGENAGKSTSGACDADFMNQIYSRALIEAERENVTGQTVIRKPDSVLEYTCFDQIVSRTAKSVGSFFSETILGNTSLDNALEILVLDSLKKYVDSNFKHDFLGGSADGQNNSISASIGSGNYDCLFMNSMYYLSKCRDFAVDDLFMSFEELAVRDPRSLPKTCSPSKTMITSDYINLANNSSTNVNEYPYVNFDSSKENYLNRMLIGTLGHKCFNPPIPTGLMVTVVIKNVGSSGHVIIQNSETFPEHVCPNPSCYYNYKTSECKQN